MVINTKVKNNIAEKGERRSWEQRRDHFGKDAKDARTEKVLFEQRPIGVRE